MRHTTSILGSLLVAAACLTVQTPVNAEGTDMPATEENDAINSAYMPQTQRNDTLSPEELKIKKSIDATKIVFIGNGDKPARDSVTSLISRFYYDQFRHFQDPQAPYFMLMSKTGKLAFGAGGLVMVRGWYDWNGAMPGADFAPADIQLPKDPSNKNKLDATAASSKLFFTLLGENRFLGNFMAYLECSFNGGGNSHYVKLKKAYVKFRDWTVGYAPSTFNDPSAEAPVIDSQGQNGEISHTTTLVRYMHTFHDRFTVAGSVEIPDFEAQEIEGQTQKNSKFFPDLAAFLQYHWGRGNSHVRLSFIYKHMAYRDLLKQKNHSVGGYGIQASAAIRLNRQIKLYSIVNTGKGIGSYSNDLSIASQDLVSDPDCPGTLYAPRSWSYAIGAQYNFTNDIYASATFNQTRYLPRKTVEGKDYKYGLYGAFSLFWDMTSRLQVGAEYLYGKRVNFNHQHGCADRINVLFQFSF